jgi:citrate synthase
MSDQKVTLTHPGGSLELPVVPATEGGSGVDTSALLKQTGYVALDTGFVNTASCTSAITYIDGDAGILRYRGYPIEQLAEKSNFIETSYLLIYGELPTATQLTEFDQLLRRHTLLHEDLKQFFDGFPRDAHPMPVLSSAVSALSTFYQDSLNPFDSRQVEISTVRLLAKLPTIAAYAYKKSVGQPFLYPDNSLGLVENFLRMAFGFPAEPYEVDPRSPRRSTCCYPARRPRAELLHVDVALVGSPGEPVRVVSAGITRCSGPLHGGQPGRLEMLQEITERAATSRLRAR